MRVLFSLALAVMLGFPVSAPSAWALAVATNDTLHAPATGHNRDAEQLIAGEFEEGQTFIAVTVPDVAITRTQRKNIDNAARGPIGAAFGTNTAFRMGGAAPALAEQMRHLDPAAQTNMQQRVMTQYAALVDAANARGHAEEFKSRRMVFVTGDDDPTLLSEGELHLVGLSGNYHTAEAPHGSHYGKLALFEAAIPALGEAEARLFLEVWVDHETQVLNAGRYVRPSAEDNRILNDGFTKIQAYLQQQAATRAEAERQQRIKAAETKAQRMTQQVQAVPYVFHLGRYYRDGRIPDAVVQAVQQALDGAKANREITDVRIRRYNGVLFVYLTYNGPARNPEQDHLVSSIVAHAIETHTDGVVLSDAYHKEFAGVKPSERIAALPLVTGALGFSERAAEPIYVAVALGGDISAFNLPIAQIFMREAVENQQKIEGLDDASLMKLVETNQAELRDEALREGPGYVFVIERASDVLAGKRDRIAYYISTQQAPYINVLIHDQTDWVVTKVLPRPGTKLYDPSKPPLEQDPIAAIAVDRVNGAWTGQEAFSPVFVARQQSGAPAVGEFTAGIARFYIAPAGPNGEFHQGVVPVTEQEADLGSSVDGRVQMVAFSYQSYAKGRIPESGARDQVALSHDIPLLRDDHKWVHDALALHGTFQPHATGAVAVRRAEATVHALGGRYHEIPAVIESDADGNPVLTPSGKARIKLDPILRPSNERAVITLSDFKADIGGEPGHQLPPDIYFATLRASLKVAQRAGLIKGYDVQSVGDDMHLIIFHNHGVDSREMHTLAWESFFRSGWVLKQINYPELKGYQPYGFMQDLVDPEAVRLIREGRLEAFANLTDEFIDALAEEIEAFPTEAKYMPNIRNAYEAVKIGKAEGTVIEVPFSGNGRGRGYGFAEGAVVMEDGRLPFVRSSRIGYAEYHLPEEWSLIASDKTGPGYYNYRTYWATKLALLLARRFSDPEEIRRLPYRAPEVLFRQEKAAFLLEFEAATPGLSREARVAFVEAFFDELTAQLTGDDLQRLSSVVRNGAVYELWDVKPNTRVFLDAQADDPAILALLSATNEHNIKRLWSKKRAGWIQDLTPAELDAINRKVDAAEGSLLEELRLRQAQVKAERRQGKKFDQLTPWEQELDTKSDKELLPVVRARMVELLKVREFLADDYFVSASTEKLAVAGGGLYLGKDDPTAWFIDPLAKVFRAMSKVGILVTLGNARGSHWAAVRPESRDLAVADKWSNPVDVSSRFQIRPDGSVPVDQGGHVVSEDMYAGREYDAARARVARFNEIWIGVQGGFTPHGPNFKDVEADYPYPATQRKLTAPDSPFAHPLTDRTGETLEQARWVGQFGALGYQSYSPAVARRVVDTATPFTVLLHEAFFSGGPDGAVQIERFLDYVREVGGYPSVEEALNKSAVRLVVALEPSPLSPPQRLRQLISTVNEAVHGAARLKVEWFTAVTTTDQPKAVAAAIGPALWLERTPSATGRSVTDETHSAAAAFSAGVEAAATGGVLVDHVKAKLDILAEAGIMRPTELKVQPDVEADLQAYRRTVASTGGAV